MDQDWVMLLRMRGGRELRGGGEVACRRGTGLGRWLELLQAAGNQGCDRLLLQSYGVWRLGEILCVASNCSAPLARLYAQLTDLRVREVMAEDCRRWR